jgi:phosphohistidine phosphatase SixA
MQNDKSIIEDWKKSKRYKENPYDEPLTIKGVEETIQTAQQLLKIIDINHFKYIYSSPMTRCMETAKNIIDVIKKETGKEYKIRIVYDLTESVDLGYYAHAITFINKVQKLNYLMKPIRDDDVITTIDEKLKFNNLVKKYKKYIDSDYKSTNPVDIDPKLRIKNYTHIIDQIVKDNSIIVGHAGDPFFTLYHYIMQDKYNVKKQIQLEMKTGGIPNCNFVTIFKKMKKWKVSFGPERLI